jgi:hypothetical protein
MAASGGRVGPLSAPSWRTVVRVPHDDRPPTPSDPPVGVAIAGEGGADGRFEAVEGDVREQRREHASNDLANILRGLTVTVPRDQLRPAYGDGFAGAPWHPRTAGGQVSERDSEEPDDGSRTAHASDAGGPSDV